MPPYLILDAFMVSGVHKSAEDCLSVLRFHNSNFFGMRTAAALSLFVVFVAYFILDHPFFLKRMRY